MPDDKRYKRYRWIKLRETILRRDHYECQWCADKGEVTKAEVVHHIKESDRFPELMYEPSNLISLCRNCHEIHHGRIAVRKAEDERFPEWW